jgi:3-methyladenine DNA glycosylase Tag
MTWHIDPPRDDDEYFERMSRAVFQAGLNWKVVENKWPGFKKAFLNFSIDRVAAFTEKDIASLMANTAVVRNEKKIRATIFNAQEFKRVKKEFGSFPRYIGSFKGAEYGLANDIHERFRFLGPSTARMYLWMVGMKLTPNAEEKAWIAQHDK